MRLHDLSHDGAVIRIGECELTRGLPATAGDGTTLLDERLTFIYSPSPMLLHITESGRDLQLPAHSVTKLRPQFRVHLRGLEGDLQPYVARVPDQLPACDGYARILVEQQEASTGNKYAMDARQLSPLVRYFDHHGGQTSRIDHAIAIYSDDSRLRLIEKEGTLKKERTWMVNAHKIEPIAMTAARWTQGIRDGRADAKPGDDMAGEQPHWHLFHEVYAGISGIGSVMVNGEEVRFSENQVLIAEPGDIHAMAGVQPGPEFYSHLSMQYPPVPYELKVKFSPEDPRRSAMLAERK